MQQQSLSAHSFLILVVFSCEPSRAFWPWALAASASASRFIWAKRAQHVNTSFRKRDEHSFTETWVSGILSYSLFADCLLSPLISLTCDWALTSTATPPKSSAIPHHRRTVLLALQQELFHFTFFHSNYFGSHVCSRENLTLSCFQCALCLHPFLVSAVSIHWAIYSRLYYNGTQFTDIQLFYRLLLHFLPCF